MDNAEAAEETVDKKKTKKDKVRSAWISFAGRIVAQIVGAIATVALGVMVLHRYTSVDPRPPAPELRYNAQPNQPQVHIIIITPDTSVLAIPTRSGAARRHQLHSRP